jgi:hypothetical protein
MRPMSPHLAHDRVRALVEDRPVIVGDLLAVAALQALGRKLDGRQRVLDLMSDATRDIRPGSRPLGDDEVGNVVEGNHIGIARGALLFPRNLDAQRPLLAAPHQVDLLAEVVTGAGCSLREHAVDLRHDFGEIAPDQPLGRQTQERFSGRIDDGDPPVVLDANDGSGSRPREPPQ